MRLKVWGARGSVPSPGPETTRYGGNTTCVEVTTDDGTTIILDAGTGLRGLGMALPPDGRELHILLTHLHLDHIQGLLFFPPAFRADTRLTIWGPAAPDVSLRDRIARYLSAPLTPVEIRELPCQVDFREADETSWEIGGATIRAASVTHRGPTLGYRIECGGRSVAFIPDHEPGLGADLDALAEEWISGFALARDVDLLVHDCQYTDAEYDAHLGWGHACLRDVVALARRTGARRTVLFHHDPLHSDDLLDAFADEARARFAAVGLDPDAVSLAVESAELPLGEPAPPRV